MADARHDDPHFMPDPAGSHCVCRCERCCSANGCPECAYAAGHVFLRDDLSPGQPTTAHVAHVSACFRLSPERLRGARGGRRRDA
jgi:hypothetical protein